MIITPTSSPSNKLAQITSSLFLNAAQVAVVKVDTLVIIIIDDHIE
jgi:hypothetical protein